MPLSTEVGLGLRDIVFDVDPATPIKRHTHPTQCLADVYCGQLAGWMKTPLGTEVDLGPGHIVLDGVPALAKGAQQPPLFGPCVLWSRSLISATAELLFLLCWGDTSATSGQISPSSMKGASVNPVYCDNGKFEKETISSSNLRCSQCTGVYTEVANVSPQQSKTRAQ